MIAKQTISGGELKYRNGLVDSFGQAIHQTQRYRFNRQF